MGIICGDGSNPQSLGMETVAWPFTQREILTEASLMIYAWPQQTSQAVIWIRCGHWLSKPRCRNAALDF